MLENKKEPYQEFKSGVKFCKFIKDCRISKYYAINLQKYINLRRIMINSIDLRICKHFKILWSKSFVDLQIHKYFKILLLKSFVNLQTCKHFEILRSNLP